MVIHLLYWEDLVPRTHRTTFNSLHFPIIVILIFVNINCNYYMYVLYYDYHN